MRSGSCLKAFISQEILIWLFRWRNIIEKKQSDEDVPLPPRLDENAPPPDLATILDFVRFHAATSKGRIDNGGLITVESSNTFMEWFFAGFTRVTGTVIDEETRSIIYKVKK